MTKVESQTWRVLKPENGRTPSNEFKHGTKSSNMFKFSLAKVWTMVAGGGASVVYSDTVAVRSLAGELMP